MTLVTRLTERLKLTQPIVSAPMAFAGGGKLAAAVTNAGGLGLIGGGYGGEAWLETQFAAAGNTSVGCGFITWSLARKPQLLDRVLERKPRAVFLSFGDPAPFAAKIKAAGALLMCQCQTRSDAEIAVGLGADVVVAQGAEAGGHGGKRATMTLVPELADLLAARAPQSLLLAAGGIADGRGLAAALMLGADGVLVGSRLWASQEALVHPNLHKAALAATGDDTIRTSVTDIARQYEWPERFNIRVVKNAFVDEWHGREAQLRAVNDAQAARYSLAVAEGDAGTAASIAGEAVGLIHSIEPAATIIERMAGQAEVLLGRGAQLVRQER